MIIFTFRQACLPWDIPSHIHSFKKIWLFFKRRSPGRDIFTARSSYGNKLQISMAGAAVFSGTVVWDVAPYSLVKFFRRFQETNRLHLHTSLRHYKYGQSRLQQSWQTYTRLYGVTFSMRRSRITMLCFVPYNVYRRTYCTQLHVVNSPFHKHCEKSYIVFWNNELVLWGWLSTD